MKIEREGESPEFSKQRTWGRLGETGSWSIDMALGHVPLNALANTRAQRLIEKFLLAFEPLCLPEQIQYESVHIDDAGRILDERDERISFDSPGQPSSAQFASTLQVPEPWVVTTAFVRCSTTVILPGLDGGVSTERVPNSTECYLGYVLDSDDKEAARIHSCRISFEASIDPWVRKTLDTEIWTWRDNTAVAESNQPRLAGALRAWEQAIGSPITEWVSRYYPDQISRLGFL
jgi:hypothetical protein